MPDKGKTGARTAANCWQYLERFTPGGPITQMHNLECSFKHSCAGKWRLAGKYHSHDKYVMVHRLSHLEEFDWIFWPFHYHLAATNVFVQLCHDVSTVFVNVCLQKLQKNCRSEHISTVACRSKWAKRSYTYHKRQVCTRLGGQNSEHSTLAAYNCTYSNWCNVLIYRYLYCIGIWASRRLHAIMSWGFALWTQICNTCKQMQWTLRH